MYEITKPEDVRNAMLALESRCGKIHKDEKETLFLCGCGGVKVSKRKEDGERIRLESTACGF